MEGTRDEGWLVLGHAKVAAFPATAGGRGRIVAADNLPDDTLDPSLPCCLKVVLSMPGFFSGLGVLEVFRGTSDTRGGDLLRGAGGRGIL